MLKLFLISFVFSTSAVSGQLNFNVTDDEGDSVEFAAVLINSANPQKQQPVRDLKMKQINEQFEPYVLVVPTGGKVSFPNYDSIKHHVYSFSQTKTFELELYDEFNHTPVEFNTPGIVELGCNIHDWMLAYIYVTDSHYYGVTQDNGEAVLALPDGDYTIKVWHPNMDPKDTQVIKNISINGNTDLTWKLQYPLSQQLDFSSGFSDY